MRKATAILLTISIIAQSMVSLGLCAYYQINKKMIADKLCVNKDKPQLHCNGKCYLSRQLKKADENEKRQDRSLRDKDESCTIYTACYDLHYLPSYSFVSYMGSYIACALSTPHIVPDQPPRA